MGLYLTQAPLFIVNYYIIHTMYVPRGLLLVYGIPLETTRHSLEPNSDQIMGDSILWRCMSFINNYTCLCQIILKAHIHCFIYVCLYFIFVEH